MNKDMENVKLETLVRQVLTESEEARNSDQVLTLKIWWNTSKQSFVQVGDQWYVSVDAIKRWLPQESSIKRVRAKIQNEYKELMPTSASVLLKRQAAGRNHVTLKEWEEKHMDYSSYMND